MKIKLKYKEIFDSKEPLTQVSKLDLPIKMSFEICENMENIQKYLIFYDNKITELVKAHCDKDENGNVMQNEDGSLIVSPESRDDLYRRCMELDNFEVEIDINKINKQEFMNEVLQITPQAKIKPSSLLLLDFMFSNN